MKEKCRRKTVAERRNYLILTVDQAKAVVLEWLRQIRLERATRFGLPEVERAVWGQIFILDNWKHLEVPAFS